MIKTHKKEEDHSTINKQDSDNGLATSNTNKANKSVPEDPTKATQGSGSCCIKRTKEIRLKKNKEKLDTLHSLAASISKSNLHKYKLSFTKQIQHLHQSLISLDNGEINELIPYTLVASVNPNIPHHAQAKKALDLEQVIAVM